MSTVPARAAADPAAAVDPASVAGPAAGARTVRRIRPGDAARMRALRLEMLADSPLAFLETLAEHAARSHREYQQRILTVSTGDQVAQFVAETGGRFVGHTGAFFKSEHPGASVLFAVYITPAHRRTGLLADLVEAAAAWSRAAGRPELLLEVVTGNARAVRAYERLGFLDTGHRVPHPTVPGLTEQMMRRPA